MFIGRARAICEVFYAYLIRAYVAGLRAQIDSSDAQSPNASLEKAAELGEQALAMPKSAMEAYNEGDHRTSAAKAEEALGILNKRCTLSR